MLNGWYLLALLIQIVIILWFYKARDSNLPDIKQLVSSFPFMGPSYGVNTYILNKWMKKDYMNAYGHIYEWNNGKIQVCITWTYFSHANATLQQLVNEGFNK